MSISEIRFFRLLLAPVLIVLATGSASSAGEGAPPTRTAAAQEDQPLPRGEERQSRPTGQPLQLPMSGEDDENRVTHREDQVLVNQLVGTEVINRSGEEIARADSFVLEQNGDVAALVAEVGGFLGAGARQVAVTWDLVQIASVQESTMLRVEINEETLREAPEYTGGLQETEQQSQRNVPGQPGFVAELQPDQIDTRALSGSEILNQEGDVMGVISDFLLGQEGRIEAVIVSVDGFLGLGEKSVALEWDRFQLQQDPDDAFAYQARVDVDRDALEAAPEFVRRNGQTLGAEDSG